MKSSISTTFAFAGLMALATPTKAQLRHPRSLEEDEFDVGQSKSLSMTTADAIIYEKAVMSKTSKTSSKSSKSAKLPEIGSLMDKAFPMWEVDNEGNRVKTKPCSAESCEWNPFYVTKRYDGLHPDYGGHPTDLDVRYHFFGGSPFLGQPYPGTPHHCEQCSSDDDIKIKECPKLETKSDNGPDGAGHIPPHISLAALTWGVQDALVPLPKMFDYELHQCRVVPDVLLNMIRNYYPRAEGKKVDYPAPITRDGGDYKYEFPSGNGLDNQKAPYEAGPPHWCTKEMKESGHWDGVCPYVFKGPDAGKYRHPHIAYAALEVYLSNKVMPGKCGKTWLVNNPTFLNADRVTTDTPFPAMDADDEDDQTVDNWLGQPVFPWNYTSVDEKAVAGPLTNALVLACEI